MYSLTDNEIVMRLMYYMLGFGQQSSLYFFWQGATPSRVSRDLTNKSNIHCPCSYVLVSTDFQEYLAFYRPNASKCPPAI